MAAPVQGISTGSQERRTALQTETSTTEMDLAAAATARRETMQVASLLQWSYTPAAVAKAISLQVLENRPQAKDPFTL